MPSSPAPSAPLQGRRALVTGSTSGIGRAVAERLAHEGAVVVSGRNAEAGAEVVAAVRAAGGLAHFVRADLAEGGASARALAEEAAALLDGPVDLLVNNAALLIPGQSLLDADEATIDAALALNVKIPFVLTAALVPGMTAAGGGAVVNMGSINGVTGTAVAALYGATKSALHSLTTSWAAELAARNIRVNTVTPGPTMTPANAPAHDMLRQLTAAAPDRRPGTGEEVAAAVAFLAGPDAAHIHGVTLPVDGGFLAAH
ncbi:SDR family NAD(P)-dependent oxidoreductase [Streptomyces sp. SPB074]|uniref:SDR family NAD(P)-dependent oxidoreductase n=1 Tax=Streptomyces sp. (strain SPB074) TaxID=465543 RepID=UPI0001D1DB8B|nr:SDR family oxidoreductase [Streptomyces sp. SPB074]EFG65361.1 short chain dehydrogenase/reductase family oxidoreductase [Streptomyces sp. SPB074]